MNPISRLLIKKMSTSGAEARKSLNQDFWDWLCCLLEARPESQQIETSGIDFVDFWGQGHNVIKSNLLGMILSTSGAKDIKSSNPTPWEWFVDIWSQGQKAIQSRLLNLILSASGAKARKSSVSGTKARKSLNQHFWDWFCRLWSQGQKVIKSRLVGVISSVSGAKARKTCFL